MEVRTYPSWPWNERSTRNCIFAKVYTVGGKPKVYCSKGRQLAQKCWDGRYGLAYDTVLRSSLFVSEACRYCDLFRHDEEEI